jgi:hypothetical protein
MAKAINLGTATFTAQEAGAFLAAAATATILGQSQMDMGRDRKAAAQAVMIAGFSSDDVAMRDWSFDILASDGTVHEYVRTVGARDFGNTDLSWCRNGDGKISKTAQTAYKTALQSTFFSLIKPVASVWTSTSKAIPIAHAIRFEGMTATIANGELKLEGGDTERAKAMREAKTLSALAKVVAGETGTNRDAPQNGGGKSEGEGEGEGGMVPATPEEILRAAAALVAGVAKGNEAVTNAALSFARKIAAIVAANPDTFAAD